MTRITILEREDMNTEQGKVFDDIKAAGSPTGGPFWAYIRHPILMRLTSDLGGYLRESDLSGRERQIAVLTVIRFWGGNYPWAVQVRSSLDVGLDQEIVDAINRRREPPITDPRERAAYQVASELASTHRLSDQTYAAAEAEKQKLRAGIVATGVRNAAILGVIAFILLFASIVALLVGLIHVLEPMIGPLGATLAVFGAGLVITIILALLAKGCITRMKKALAP